MDLIFELLCSDLILFAGKVHGSLARAGKVRGQTPKVAKQEKKKRPRGRAHKREQYNRRFVTAGTFFFPSL
ncbi:40S ribosomal protein S30-B [Linum perenne]